MWVKSKMCCEMVVAWSNGLLDQFSVALTVPTVGEPSAGVLGRDLG